MRRIVATFALILTALTGSEVFALHEGDIAPTFVLPLADGSNFSSESVKGKVVYLDFWASWCPPCRDALDFLKELKSTHEGKGVEIVAVNLDNSRADADEVIGEIQPQFRVLFDPKGSVAKQFELPKMPTSFVIGKDGRIRKIHGGYKCADKPEILAVIQSALEEK